MTTDGKTQPAGRYHIRLMRDGDIARLVEIDRLADRLFIETGIAELAAMARGPRTPATEFKTMLDACSVHVACTADDVPVGLAAAQPLEGDIYLRLLAVDPDHGRRGLGSTLIRQTVIHGQRISASRCALSTFREVAFNAPFYARHGFVELPLPLASNALRQRFELEVPDGINPDQRLLMVLDL
jgi:GNAT superfamily N-acetyltransferase